MISSQNENDDIPDRIFFKWLALMLGFAMLFDMPLIFGSVGLTLVPLALFIFNNHLPPLAIFMPWMAAILVLGFFGGFRVGVRGADWAMKRFFKTDMAQWD